MCNLRVNIVIKIGIKEPLFISARVLQKRSGSIGQIDANKSSELVNLLLFDKSRCVESPKCVHLCF